MGGRALVDPTSGVRRRRAAGDVTADADWLNLEQVKRLGELARRLLDATPAKAANSN